MRNPLIKRKIFSFIFLISLLISCSSKTKEILNKDSLDNSLYTESINLPNLMKDLLEADQKLTPKKIYNIDGSYFFSYKKRIGEDEMSVKEIKKRISLGSDYFKNDRENVRELLTKLNQLKINNKLDKIYNGALGLWIPKRDLIIIDFKVVPMGSQIFNEILSHESIHVAQSCFTNSRKNFPQRIGLPLDFSTEINLNLSHEIYSNNSEEVINIEREAFTYSKIDGAAIKLLNRFCK